MNPNSQHQLWSRWDVTITPPPGRPAPTELEVRLGWVRFVRKCFQTTAGECRVVRRAGKRAVFSLRTKAVQWFAQARVEGVPAHDPAYRTTIEARIVTFFGSGFGTGTKVRIDVCIEAGDVQDGTPPAQLIMLPTLTPEGNHQLTPI